LCLAAVLVFSACGSDQPANNTTLLLEEKEDVLPQSIRDENQRIIDNSWDFLVDVSFTMDGVIISDSLPAFIFRISKVDELEVPDEVLEAEWNYSDQYYQVVVAYQEQPNVVLDMFYFGTQEEISMSSVSFVDIDCDGFMDIEIGAGMGNVNRILKYFRWDSMQKHYDEKPFFVMSAADYQIFPDTKQIVAETRSSAFAYQRALYQLIDENYVQLRAEESEAIETMNNGYQWKVVIRDEQGEIYSEILTEEEYENTSLRDSILRDYGIKESMEIAKVRLLLDKAYGETILYDDGGLVHEYSVSIVFDKKATLNGATCYAFQVYYFVDDNHWVLIEDVYAASDGTILYSDNHDYSFFDEN